MEYQITRICLSLVAGLFTVNSYLVKTETGFILVDTAWPWNRRKLELELKRHGCGRGMLKLILLTHGDIDHTGNAVHLRQQLGAPIAMHPADVGMFENGDMFWNRKFERKFLKIIVRRFFPVRRADLGSPDILLNDGDTLLPYGLQASVINTPGHSAGSICLLTDLGDLFCGDLLTNSYARPRLNSMLYDHPAGQASFERLKTMPIQTVYSGHGEPFAWEELINKPSPKSL